MKNTIIAVLVIVVAGTSGVFLYKKFAQETTNTPSQAGLAQGINTSASAVAQETYSNTKYGFTLDFPDSWKGYRVKEEADLVSFGIQDKDGMFFIKIFTKQQWADYQKGELKPLRFIGQNTMYVFSSGQAHDYTNSVISLSPLIPSIISTFKFSSTSSEDASVPAKSKSITDDGINDGVNNNFATVGKESRALAFDTAGNLYTANDGRTISKITPSGTVSTFAKLDFMPTYIIFDAQDNLYAEKSRIHSGHTISKITPEGVATILAVMGGCQVDSKSVVDASGNFYTTDCYRKSERNADIESSIKKITPSGTITTFAKLCNSIGNLATDKLGNIYAGCDDQTIRKITPQGVVTTFATTSSNPGPLVIDTQGNLYIISVVRGRTTIYKITPHGTVITFVTFDTFGLKNPYPFLFFDGSDNLYATNISEERDPMDSVSIISKITLSGVVTKFATVTNRIEDIAFDSSGNLYIGNYGTGTISKLISKPIPPNGGFEAGTKSSTTVFGSGSSASVGIMPKVSTFVTLSAGFYHDVSGDAYMAFDSSDNLYIAESSHGRGSISIGKVTPSGIISTFASLPAGVSSLAFDKTDNLYVTGNRRTVSKIAQSGLVTDFATIGGQPWAAGFDEDGNLYTANLDGDYYREVFGNNTVSKITPSGTVTNFATAEFIRPYLPSAIAFDTSGSFYAALGDKSIEKVTLSGATTTFATLGSVSRALAFDKLGNLYALGDKSISKITPTGTVSTVAVVKPNLNALTLDKTGNLYVADFSTSTKNTIISKITLLPLTSGTFTSAIINTEAISSFTTLEYATTLNGQTITMDARAGNTATPDNSWTAWQKNVANGGDISALSGNQYFQYRANFSTTNKDITPTLDSVTVNFTQ